MERGRGAGKLLTLAMLMEEYGEEVYADLLQFYGVEVDKISPRRALALVRQLPSQARFIAVQEAHRDSFQWDKTASILADLYDMLATLTTMTAKANAGKKGKKITAPEPYPRPGDKVKKGKRKKSNHLLSTLRGDTKVKNPFADDDKIVPLIP